MSDCRLCNQLIIAALYISLLAGANDLAGQDSSRPDSADVEESKSNIDQHQVIGYIGQTSKSKIARYALERLRNKNYDDFFGRSGSATLDRVLMWHTILLDTIALDHTKDPVTEILVFEQGGPTRTSRVIAMTMTAVFDAVNAFEQNFVSYNDIGVAPEGASMDAAIANAAYTVLSELYPSQSFRLKTLVGADLAKIANDTSMEAINSGGLVGVAAGKAMVNARSNDNSIDPEPLWGEGGRCADGKTNFYGDPVNGGTLGQFQWEPDPLGTGTLALGAYWGGVTPFILASGDQYRVPPAPEPGTLDYITGYYLVRFIGASVDTPGSLSTPDARFIGNYWGYDAVPFLCSPPRLYSQIAVSIAVNQGVNDPVEMARLLAMVGVVQADSGIAAWDSKFFYNYWRPVTGIRNDDGDPLTPTVKGWKPVGVSVINTDTPAAPTPPFPAHPSGHATFGAAVFELMRHFFGNETPFTFVSEEYDGIGVDPNGLPRPLTPVRWNSMLEAQEANGISRIYNGVHWQWDNALAQTLGEQIASHLLNQSEAFQPIGGVQPVAGLPVRSQASGK